MSELDFSSIEPLIAASDLKGNSLHIRFRCPVTGVEAAAKARVQRLADLRSQVSRSVKKSLFSGLRRTATRAVSDALGSGLVGKIARDVSTTGLRKVEQDHAFGEEELRAATVAAFEDVRECFRWDEDRSAWIGVAAPAAARNSGS